MCSNVDLPEPLRPTKQIRSPAATAKVAPESSGVTPKVRLMSRSRSSGGGGVGGYGSGCSRRYGSAIASVFRRRLHLWSARPLLGGSINLRMGHFVVDLGLRLRDALFQGRIAMIGISVAALGYFPHAPTG
jgi:hypothetical protein